MSVLYVSTYWSPPILAIAQHVDTDAAGNYTIQATAGGSYFLYFKYVGTGQFSSEYPADPYSNLQADEFSVVAGGLVTENITLPTRAAITGSVSLGTAGNLAPANSVSVSYKIGDGSSFGAESTPVPIATAGTYTIPSLSAGDYAIHFTYLEGNAYQSAWYQVNGNDVVSFAGGSDLTLNFVVPSTRTITGHISLGASGISAGAGQIAISYYYYSCNCNGYQDVIPTTFTTDANGNYAVTGLIDGYYGLKFSVIGDPSYLLSESAQIAVNGSTTNVLNATIVHTVAVKGHVDLNDATNANPSSAPANSVTVSLVPIPGSPASVGGPGYQSPVTVDSSGNFVLPHVIDYETYTLLYQHTRTACVDGTCTDYSNTYLGGLVATGGLATPPAGATYFNTNGSDVVVASQTLAFNNEISGTVTNDSGAPLAGIRVWAKLYASGGSWVYVDWATTDANGIYTIRGGLPDGTYGLYFLDLTSTYLPQDYSDESVYYEPDTFPVAGGGVLSGGDAVMHLPSQISGTVTAAGSSAGDIADGDVYVEVEVFDGPSQTWQETGDYYPVSASNGAYRYSIPNLSPDGYKLLFVYDSPTLQGRLLSPVLGTVGGAATTYNATIPTRLPGRTVDAVEALTGSRSGVTVTGYAYFPDSTDTAVNVAVNIGSGWYSVEADKPDANVTVPPGDNPDHGFSQTITVAPGTYSACVWVSQPTGPATEVLPCHTVTVAPPLPAVFKVVFVTGGATPGTTFGTVGIQGWAYWPDFPGTSVPVSLRSSTLAYSVDDVANAPDPGPEAADPGIGPNHGFNTLWVGATPGSTVTICGLIGEPTGGYASQCQTIVVPVPARTVAADTLTGTTTGIDLSGYAVWPDAIDAHPTMAVNIGSQWYGFSENADSPDARVAVPGSGPGHGFTGSIPLPPGIYNACVYVTEQSGPSVNIGCQSVGVAQRPRTVYGFDSAGGSAAGVSVSGYALYPDAPATSVGVALNIGSGWYGLTANQPNSDAGAGTNHGFSGTVALAPGSYNVCVWVTEPSGPAVNTGCHTVVVPAPARTTYGLDSISGSTAGVSIAGWALFPDSPASSVGIALNIGSGWYGLTANQANSDAGAGTNHGYSGTVALAPGTYNVCVWVTEPSGPALNTGCHAVVVPMAARAVVQSDSVTGGVGSLTVTGWDVFPGSLSTHVGMALNIGSGWYGLTANVTNAEVPIVYPAATADHGYSDTLAMAPGTYSVCIWTTEPSGPAVNAGCHSVVVTAPHAAVSTIDSVTGGVGTVSVAGWDVFPDSLSTQVGMAISIGSSWYALTANSPNPESASAYPTSTVDHGFAGSVGLKPGAYNVCLWTTEPTGPAVNIGCRTATVTAAPSAVTSYDAATAVTGGIQVTGYSQFPGAPSTVVGVAAQIGSNWFGFTANGAASNPTYNGHGFTGFIPAGHGTYNVCMWTTEPAGGAAMSFGCKSVVVP